MWNLKLKRPGISAADSITELFKGEIESCGDMAVVEVDKDSVRTYLRLGLKEGNAAIEVAR